MLASHIVVPLDGTAVSERAIPVAKEIAERAGGTLRLVRVHVPPRIPATSHRVLGPRVGEKLKRDRAEARKRDQAYLDEAGGEVEPSASEVSTALLRGPVGPSLLDDVRRSDATLVVLAAPVPGRDDPDRLDAVTDSVVRGCPTPILVVRTGDAPAAGEPVGIGHALIPLDGSRRSRSAVEPAAELARLFEAPVTLIRVFQKEGRPGEETAGRKELEAVSESLAEKGVDADWVLEHGDPAEAILRVAAEREIDVIAMASRCRGPLTRMVLGSVSNKVLRRASASVLVVTPTA